MKTRKVIFVRHGQSTANAGVWNDDFAAIELTKLGHEQSAALAEAWQEAPAFIVVSPFVRTQQTARPTIARFPHVPVETWDVHEFTYWDMANWKGSSPDLQPQEVERFWTACDPHYKHGPGAETFADLLGRAEDALRRLAQMDVPGDIVVFTHGHFIQALRHTLLFPDWTPRQKMLNFKTFDRERWVANTEKVVVEFDGRNWRLVESQPPVEAEAALR